MKISEVLAKLEKIKGRYGDIDTCIENVLDNTIADMSDKSAIIENTLVFYDSAENYKHDD